MTHTRDNPDSPSVLIQSRLEAKNPDLDHSTSYRLSRIFGLAPEQKSFNFKMIQSLLPTKNCLVRMGKVQSSLSSLHCDEVSDSTDHLLTCSQSREVSTRLMSYLTSYFPNISPADVVILNVPATESLELPAV